MIYRKDSTVPLDLLEQLRSQDLEVVPELIRVILNATMQAERAGHLKAVPCQHTIERQG